MIADTIECAMRLGVLKLDAAMSLVVADEEEGEGARNRRIAQILDKILDARSAMTKVTELLEAGKAGME